jgi:hypothetical protein
VAFEFFTDDYCLWLILKTLPEAPAFGGDMKAATASARVERVRYLLNSYQKYYNEARTHLSLHKDAPIPRAVHTVGRTLAVPVLGRTAPSIFQGVSFRQGHR